MQSCVSALHGASPLGNFTTPPAVCSNANPPARPAAGAIAFLRLPAASCRRQERPVRCPMDLSQTTINLKSLNTIHHRGQLSTTWLLVEMASHADTVCLGIELKISWWQLFVILV
jgi:hypothetical protein